MPVTIYTNMDWKASHNYSAANGTAGEADPETGIVKCEAGTVARTDELEIRFCGDLPEDQAQKIRDDIASLKGTGRIATTPSEIAAQASQGTACMKYDGVVRVSGYNRSVVASDGSSFTVRYTYDRDSRVEYRDNYLSGLVESASGAAADKANADYCYSNNI